MEIKNLKLVENSYLQDQHGQFFFIQFMGTLLSRISGFVRLIVAGALLGVSRLNDIFIIAFMVPNLLRTVLAEEAIKNSFVPVYRGLLVEKDRNKIRDFTKMISGAILILLFLVVLAGIIFSPYYLPLIAAGFSKEEIKLTVYSLRIIFPFLIFIGYSSLLMGIFYCREATFAHKITSLAPVAFNIGASVVAIPAFFEPFKDKSLAFLSFGLLLGGVLQLLVLFPFIFKRSDQFEPTDLIPSLPAKTEPIREVSRQWLPSIAGGAVIQVNTFVDRAIGSFLGSGAITGLAYAVRLFQLPVGAIGVSTAVAIHSSLSKNWYENDREVFIKNLMWGIKRVIFYTLPATVFFILSARLIISSLFQYGAFNREGTTTTAIALIFYAGGVIFYSLTRIFKVCFSAIKDNKTYALIDVITIALNIVFNLTLVKILLLYKFLPPHSGLAMGTTLSAIIQNWILVWLLKKDTRLGRDFHLKEQDRKWFLKLLCSTLVMMIAVGIGKAILGNELDMAKFYYRIAGLIFLGLMAGFSYLLTGVILGIDLAYELLSKIQKLIKIQRVSH